MNKDQIRAKQQADPVLSEVFSWVQNQKRPNFGNISHEGSELKFYWGQFRSLKIMDGILIRIGPSKFAHEKTDSVTPDLRTEALNECHSVLTAGHLGQKKTLANVKRRFLWPGMTRDTEAMSDVVTLVLNTKLMGRKTSRS